jgi:hypothetical protein
VGISWSAMRKKLEQENLCASLKGRVKYFATRYRKTHDCEGGVAVRVDGREVLRSDFFKWAKLMYTDRPRCEFNEKSWDEINMDTHEKAGFDQYAFYSAFYKYDNQSIEQSLNSDDAIVRMFAVLDKRTGRRTLEKLLPAAAGQPEWLIFFYRLRIQAENMDISALKKEQSE